MTNCWHPQAEPVVLADGETVACVCITCFAPLPAGYIDDQRRFAEVKARCTHEWTIELAELGKLKSDHMCTECGEIL